MKSTLYIPRRLSHSDRVYAEDELLAASSYIVVLAEPGGGKTALMESLAEKLGTDAVTANVFVHVENNAENSPLVIDGFDELARVDNSGIHRLLAKARKTDPTYVIISSRSSEWDNASTNAFQDFLGQSPLVVRLYEFNEIEQREIFDHHVPGEDFTAFQSEVSRFDLNALLPNPQFLKLFADAYIESGRGFTDKRAIFEQAVERLAKEVNVTVARSTPVLSTAQKVIISSEVFAKLLLSGAEGVCMSEASEDRVYPLLASLVNAETGTDSILATRLFKPGEMADQHRPVHKIVAEYCAADYLVKKIADPTDSLTIQKCLSVIAPNSIVRDELRGVLAWIASLGSKTIEESAIELDPYAVLANGDPSQLEHSSKRLLVNRLKEVEDKDPYFRRGDFWRRFSVAGFFTQETIGEIKNLLTSGSDGHLRDLILELLVGSQAIEQIEYELSQLVLSPNESESTRLLASECLFSSMSFGQQGYLSILIFEASLTSLKVAANIIQTLGLKSLDRKYLEGFFRVSAKLYPVRKNNVRRVIGGRYFIKDLISKLDYPTTEWLLDEFTKNFACICNKEPYKCDCRNGISKIVGAILDRYFELINLPYEPQRIWKWMKNLKFDGHRSADQSKSVKVLQENDELRQGIIACAFENINDREKIRDIKMYKFGYLSHSGLFFRPNDYKFIVDLAFNSDNPTLWSSFIQTHHYSQGDNKQVADSLRRHMREQALQKNSFMREWAKSQRHEKEQFKKEWRLWDLKHNRIMRRRNKQQSEMHLENIKYVQENRELVESGRHWSCLVRFAELVLEKPENIKLEFGDETLARNALKNCISFITPEIPDLRELAELQCSSKGLVVETILYAACLEIMRIKGGLEDIELPLLIALRTNLNMHYSAVSAEDRAELKAEVDRLIFPDSASAENFLRQYVEPQLEDSECGHPEIWLLNNEEIFSHLRSKLSIEWLGRFSQLGLDSLDSLFDIAAQYGNRVELNKIIAERCQEFMTLWPNRTDDEDIERKRTFWLLRAWYFLNDVPEAYWEWLKADKDTVLLLNQRSGRMNHSEYSYWPRLTSTKVEAILDAFIDKWPKVDLPSHWGTGSPKGENAYRFLTGIIWSINSDAPDDSIPVLERLISDPRLRDLHNELKSIHADHSRKQVLRDFEPPTPQEVVELLDYDLVATVEGLRQLVIDELQDFQKAIKGGEFNSADRFYEGGERLGEVQSTEIITERLNLRLEPQGISVTLEHQLKNLNRSDFTVTKMIRGKRRLLVTEVKGQWHNELYTAATAQLHERYSIHPDAEQQGIFLVIWFGVDEKVAGLKSHGITSAQELKNSIEQKLPQELKGLIDIFVLDVSKKLV